MKLALVTLSAASGGMSKTGGCVVKVNKCAILQGTGPGTGVHISGTVYTPTAKLDFQPSGGHYAITGALRRAGSQSGSDCREPRCRDRLRRAAVGGQRRAHGDDRWRQLARDTRRATPGPEPHADDLQLGDPALTGQRRAQQRGRRLRGALGRTLRIEAEPDELRDAPRLGQQVLDRRADVRSAVGIGEADHVAGSHSDEVADRSHRRPGTPRRSHTPATAAVSMSTAMKPSATSAAHSSGCMSKSSCVTRRPRDATSPSGRGPEFGTRSLVDDDFREDQVADLARSHAARDPDNHDVVDRARGRASVPSLPPRASCRSRSCPRRARSNRPWPPQPDSVRSSAHAFTSGENSDGIGASSPTRLPRPALPIRVHALGAYEDNDTPVARHHPVVLVPVVVRSAGRDEDLAQQQPEPLCINARPAGSSGPINSDRTLHGRPLPARRARPPSYAAGPGGAPAWPRHPGRRRPRPRRRQPGCAITPAFTRDACTEPSARLVATMHKKLSPDAMRRKSARSVIRQLYRANGRRVWWNLPTDFSTGRSQCLLPTPRVSTRACWFCTS